MQQKRWYDKTTRECNLRAGDKVLLLLPDITQKFYRKWQGPYVITRKLGSVNYEVQIGAQLKVYHINLLKKWYPRQEEQEEQTYSQSLMADEDVGDITERGNPTQELSMGDQLTVSQKDELQILLTEFPVVMAKEPGRTDVISHSIPTVQCQPIHQ